MISFPMFFFFNDTATTEIYTLSLHDALPICPDPLDPRDRPRPARRVACAEAHAQDARGREPPPRSEEHTSELQSRQYLVCRLLLEKKKTTINIHHLSYRTPNITILHTLTSCY